MDIQQLKECLGQQTKFYLLDISKVIKILGEIDKNLDNTIIWKLQTENNIQLKYSLMENQLNVTDRMIITLYFNSELGSRMIQFRETSLGGVQMNLIVY